MPPFFINAQMLVYSYIETQEFDEYDEPLIEYRFRESIPADLQPLTPKSSMQIYGKILEDTYQVIISNDKTVYDTDIIKFENDNSTYKIIGSVSNWNHILPHKELILQKQRINEEVIDNVTT